MVTPSPAPGVGDSPFMTWGRVDATPLRLDPFAAAEDATPADLAAAAAGRAAFHIAAPRRRGAWALERLWRAVLVRPAATVESAA